jgi:hypothetical protein
MKLEEEGGKWSCPAWKRVVYIKKGRQGWLWHFAPQPLPLLIPRVQKLVITLALLARF